MSPHSIAIRALIVLACAATLCTAPAQAQRKEVKIGVIFDYTGPFAAGGSQAAALGTKIAIDMINERGGVEGYKIVPIYADAQSKAHLQRIHQEIRSGIAALQPSLGTAAGREQLADFLQMKAAEAKQVSSDAQQASVRLAANMQAVGLQFESASAPWRPWGDNDSGPVDEWARP